MADAKNRHRDDLAEGQIMWLKWFPWEYIVRRFARSRGFIDPISVLAYARRFAQPSEVTEPVELLRAGMVFHARGLINSRAIQHNLDWIWPYWVERQFDPNDSSFVPRAFSITHINLTHRNWTAVGIPDCPDMPIVDPRGLVTPFYDGWSVDAWIATESGRILAPSKFKQADQSMEMDGNIVIRTRCENDVGTLQTRAETVLGAEGPECRVHCEGAADEAGWLVIALRPYNPEGVSFIHRIAMSEDRTGWTVEKHASVTLSEPADRHSLSTYEKGDVASTLTADRKSSAVCDVGMATAAALFALQPNVQRSITVSIPLGDAEHPHYRMTKSAKGLWTECLATACALHVPDQRIQFLYDASMRSLILHSPDDVFPGPYTYKRFWFRDAAFLIHALLHANWVDRAERALRRFPERQNLNGYFHSQDGEWDSNGEALWILDRFYRVTGRVPAPEWLRAIRKGAQWILHKRTPREEASPHAGLLPAGFSAEHLGPNDFYYWDDFWGVAGLHAAARLLRSANDPDHAEECEAGAHSFMASIDRSLRIASERLASTAMPASPYRRMDAGAVGSLAAGYPTELFEPRDERLMETVNYLWDNCRVDGGFFQDMIHSGINPYLTLHMAQVYLRAGDERCHELIDTVARLASPTGQWPEAVHPATKGGCMGDGQHAWASAEWICMIRNCFVMEDQRENRLILGAGLRDEWLADGATVSLGPTMTAWGSVTVTFSGNGDHVDVNWNADWHHGAPRVCIRLEGRPEVVADGAHNHARVEPVFVS